MKRIMLFTTVIAVMIFGFSVTAGAVSITINTENLDHDIAAEVLRAEKKGKENFQESEKSKAPIVDDVEAWVGLGEKVGLAIVAACKQLSIEVNEFIKTPVGMVTMGLIVYKVVGGNLWDAIGGSLAWFVIVSIIFFSFRHFHMRERIVDKSNKENPKIEYIPRYEFKTNDARLVSALSHAAVFVIITLVCLLIVFS